MRQLAGTKGGQDPLSHVLCPQLCFHHQFQEAEICFPTNWTSPPPPPSSFLLPSPHMHFVCFLLYDIQRVQLLFILWSFGLLVELIKCDRWNLLMPEKGWHWTTGQLLSNISLPAHFWPHSRQVCTFSLWHFKSHKRYAPLLNFSHFEFCPIYAP